MIYPDGLAIDLRHAASLIEHNPGLHGSSKFVDTLRRVADEMNELGTVTLWFGRDSAGIVVAFQEDPSWTQSHADYGFWEGTELLTTDALALAKELGIELNNEEKRKIEFTVDVGDVEGVKWPYPFYPNLHVRGRWMAAWSNEPTEAHDHICKSCDQCGHPTPRFSLILDGYECSECASKQRR